MNFEARLSAVREPVITKQFDKSMLPRRAVAVGDEPGFDSAITASKVRLATSFGIVVRSFIIVIEASLNTCLYFAWISGSLVSNKTLNTDEESDMKAPREEEGRIIAQSRFDVNREILRAGTCNQNTQLRERIIETERR
jgi:hypothetical protein